jgi:hypothetical protein
MMWDGTVESRRMIVIVGECTTRDLIFDDRKGKVEKQQK